MIIVASLTLAGTASAGNRVLYTGGVFGPIAGAETIGSDGSITPIVGSPFGSTPYVSNGMVQTPDGRFLYASDAGYSKIHAFEVNPNGGLTQKADLTYTTLPDPDPSGIAVAPDGKHAYVADPGPEAVRVINIAADGEISDGGVAPMTGSDAAVGVAITPDGRYLYSTATNTGKVYLFSINSNGSLTPLSTPSIATSSFPTSLSITPDGQKMYVAGSGGLGIAGYNIADNGSLAAITGSPFGAGTTYREADVSPNGRRLMAATGGATGSLAVFDIAASGVLTQIPGSPYAVTGESRALAVSPDSDKVFLGGSLSPSYVTAYSGAASSVLSPVTGSPFTAGTDLPVLQGLVVSPNQPAKASFTYVLSEKNLKATFDAGASRDPDGTVASYAWDFGDGVTDVTTSPVIEHTYATYGTFSAKLTVTDDEGCSTKFVYTGQSAACNGSKTSEASVGLTATPPVTPSKLVLNISAKKKQRIRKKFSFTATCSQNCGIVSKAIIKCSSCRGKKKKAVGRAVKKGPRLIGGKKTALKINIGTKLRKKALRLKTRGKRLRLTLQVNAVTDSGDRTVRSAAVALKR